MRKMKILAMSFLTIAFMFVSTINVDAASQKEKQSKPYYTNLNNVEMTKTQYDNLARAFNEDTIATLTQDMVDELANDTTLTTRSSTKYVKIDTIVDVFGNIIDVIEEEVTEAEAMEFEANPPLQTRGNPVHQTTMKKLTINMTTGASAYTKIITVTSEWLAGQMPATRSHDVIAIRPNKSFYIKTSNSISGYLKHNGSIVQNYSQGHSNIVESPSGIGLSMPLPSGGTSMSHGLTITVTSNEDPFDAYGSFQHAQSAVTLAQSKAYSLKVSGRTNIIRFTNAATAAKYDNMQSVDCSWSTSTLSCN